jgi:hypothetical protein
MIIAIVPIPLPGLHANWERGSERQKLGMKLGFQTKDTKVSYFLTEELIHVHDKRSSFIQQSV